MRAAPDDSSEQVTQALAGEPLTVDERRDGWARIRTGYDYPGWIREEALGPGDAQLPTPRDGDPVAEARSYLGAPYEWGGLTERGIDCSGLVHMAYRRLGKVVPRDADQQEAAAQRLEEGQAQPGDLVCFGPVGEAHHIAFCLGEGRILHATSREGTGKVLEEPLDNARSDHEIRFARF